MNDFLPTPPNSSEQPPKTQDNRDPYDPLEQHPSALRRYLWPVVIGLIVTSIAMVLFYTRMRGVAAVASGSVVQLTIYPMHPVVDPDMPGPGMPGAPLDQDQVIVFAEVQVKNLSHNPLEIFDLAATMKSQQLDPQRSLGASPVDVDRLFQAFPEIAHLRAPLLLRHVVIAPGQSATGQVVFNYPISKQEWNQRSGFQIKVSFENGPSLVLDAR